MSGLVPENVSVDGVSVAVAATPTAVVAPAGTVDGVVAAAPVPSIADQLKASATRVEYETDALGRRLGVKRLNALAVFELSLLLGAAASNASVVDQAMAASSVVEIDGEPLPLPANILDLKARIQRIDFVGYAAAAAALARLTKIVDPNASKAAVKN